MARLVLAEPFGPGPFGVAGNEAAHGLRREVNPGDIGHMRKVFEVQVLSVLLQKILLEVGALGPAQELRHTDKHHLCTAATR